MSREVAELDELLALQSTHSSTSATGSTYEAQSSESVSAEGESSTSFGAGQQQRSREIPAAQARSPAARVQASRQYSPAPPYSSASGFANNPILFGDESGWSSEDLQVLQGLGGFMVSSPNIDWSFLGDWEAAREWDIGGGEEEGTVQEE